MPSVLVLPRLAANGGPEERQERRRRRSGGDWLSDVGGQRWDGAFPLWLSSSKAQHPTCPPLTRVDILNARHLQDLRGGKSGGGAERRAGGTWGRSPPSGALRPVAPLPRLPPAAPALLQHTACAAPSWACAPPRCRHLRRRGGAGASTRCGAARRVTEAAAVACKAGKQARLGRSPRGAGMRRTDTLPHLPVTCAAGRGVC